MTKIGIPKETFNGEKRVAATRNLINIVLKMRPLKNFPYFWIFLLILTISLSPFSINAQKYGDFERGKAKDMLNTIRKEIKGNYYDTSFKGIDIDAKFDEAANKLKTSQSTGQSFGIIAQAVLELNDSHTRFYPPSTTVETNYGFKMQMIGDKCLVTAIKPGSDAAAKLKLGDEIITLENFKPSRKDLWKMLYYYNVISPRSGLNLKILSPNDTEPRELNVAAKIRKAAQSVSLEALIRQIELQDSPSTVHRFVKLGNTVIWKMPTFSIQPQSIDEIMKGKIAGSGNLILDLRGNGGGYVVTMERLAGYFVEKDTKIADLKGRKKMDPQMAKTRGNSIYKGKLIVLVDSTSASASEIFARFMQLEQRGIVIGDISAGAVMQSQVRQLKLGAENIVFYGMNLTNADVIMTDGLSLEHVGLTPQLHLVPTPAQVAASDDVVLAAALKLLDQPIPPQEAGKLFPNEWPDEN